MIVRDDEGKTVLIPQHAHAAISGEIARHWRKDDPESPVLRPEAIMAIEQHDRAWIPLDEVPKQKPDGSGYYSFIDYPLTDKLRAYQQGVMEVREQSRYAAILCSRHYCSFFSGDTDDERIKAFIDREEGLQQADRQTLTSAEQATLDIDQKLLSFCDDVSLYLCMNKPGAAKQNEVNWFRDGFKEQFSFADKITGEWVSTDEVRLIPSPLEAPVRIVMPQIIVEGNDYRKEKLWITVA
ncbi:Protein of unknown function [Terribacillus halophilus]|uniref:DUF3891 family protein n=1 Tax=Terribacillus halophilus TaxID=361279 RepID=A0A1G6M3R8_9BACI|nr:DUF3891 family protein [Terribacillus halophilus]SDC49625.1 Protein of unknown function [Terribacillus halophilus]